MNLHQPARMTLAEFDAWAEHQERKYELVRGAVRMLPNVKRNHSRIAANVLIELGKRLDPVAYDVAGGDLAIQTGEDSIRYPDAMVERAGAPGDERRTREPILAVEVLSDSTMHSDFGEKRTEYQALANLRAYLVLAQDERRAWLWQRTDDGEWPADPEQIAEGAVAIRSLGVELALGDLYRNVTP
jgi:Uma2 family endonuclease